MLFPLLLSDPALKCETDAASPATSMLPLLLHNAGAHAVAEETITVEGAAVRCLRVDPRLSRTLLVAGRSDAATLDPHRRLVVLSTDEARQLDSQLGQLAPHMAATLSITTVSTHVATDASGVAVPSVVHRGAVISRSPEMVTRALHRIDTGTRTVPGYHLLERRNVDDLILAGLFPLASDTIDFIHGNFRRSTKPAFAKRTSEATLRRLTTAPVNRVLLERKSVPRAVSAATAAAAENDDGGDDESPLLARATTHGATTALEHAALTRDGHGSPEGAYHATKVVQAMMGPKDESMPGTGTSDGVVFGILCTLAVKAGVDLHDVRAEAGTPQRQLAHLTKDRRRQLVGCPFSALDSKAPLIVEAIAAAVQASPDGPDPQVHERHCRSIIHAALVIFPMHASVGRMAVTTPLAELPVVKDVDGCELALPLGLATLGAALASPGPSVSAPRVKLTLTPSSLSINGPAVDAALVVGQTALAHRLVALRMLRAMSNLRTMGSQCSLFSNRMNMSWYPHDRAEETLRCVSRGRFSIGTSPAALHSWCAEHVSGWPKLAMTRALMLGAGAPGVLSGSFRDDDIPAHPGSGFRDGILSIVVIMVARR